MVGKREGKLDGHHIISKGRCSYSGMFDINNGITLCFRCHRVKLETHPVEYGDFIRKWLHNQDLDYDQLKQTYEGAKTYFNKENYEIKSKVLKEVLGVLKDGK